jgi:hypothetical protein
MPHILKDANIAAISLVDRGANLKKIFLFKRADDAPGQVPVASAPAADERVEMGLLQPIIKAGAQGDEWSTIYCLVAVPGEVDQQGDVWQEDEIQKSAHDFVKSGALINFMHETLDPVGNLVESAIAPVDFTVNGEHIKKGSWYIAVQPNDEMKQLIKSGQITGVSVQGSAQRVPVFTPGIDSPGTMLHTVSKNAGRLLDGKAPKEGQRVHLASDVNQSYMILGEDPQGSGKLVLGNANGDHALVHPIDLVTPQTAEAKLEQVAAEAPKPMQMQYNQERQSPFQGIYDTAEQNAAMQPQGEMAMAGGIAKDARHPHTVTMALDGHGNVTEGVWKTIRGGRVFIDKSGKIAVGPDEVRGLDLEGLVKRVDLLPEVFEQPIVKDANGRQIHRGDRVAHLLNPSQSFPVVEVLPQGPVVEVEKDGAMIQTPFPARQVTHATGPVGGEGGNFEDLVAALIGDFDENEQLREALSQFGIHDKTQIEEAVQTGKLDQTQLRALMQFVDGPGDSSDDVNVEGTVAVRQGVGNHMFKNDSSAHSIDVLVAALNNEAVPVSKAMPTHDAAKCVAGGCSNCREGEAPVEKAAPFVCKCDCDKCSDGVCGCTKGKACKDCEKDEEKTAALLEKGGAFPGAAPPFGKGKKKKDEVGVVDDSGDQVEDADLAKESDEDEDSAEMEPEDTSGLKRKKKGAFPGAAAPFGSKGDDAENVSKHFVLGQPHEHPHAEPAEKGLFGSRKRPGRFPAAPPEGQEPPAEPGAEKPPVPVQPEALAAPEGPKLGDKPAPKLGDKPGRRPFPPRPDEAEKAGFPSTRNPDQPMGGKMGKPQAAPEPGEGEPKKPSLSPEQKATIVAELQQIAASGDKALLEALDQLGVPADQLDAVDIPDEQLLQMQEKFINIGRTSQTPNASAPGFGVGAAKAEAVMDRMTKAVAEREGWDEDPKAKLKGPRRLPASGENVIKGHGVRLTPDGAVVKAGGDVEPGKMFMAPDGQRYIAKSVSDTTVVGFAGGEERTFPRGQVKAPAHTFAKRGEKAGERFPFPDGLLAEDGKQAEAQSLAPQALVTVPGGGFGTVYSVDGDQVVVIVEHDGNLPRRREYKRKDVKLQAPVAKAGVKPGDFVKDGNGKAGEVVSVEGDTATIGYVAKDENGLSEKTRTAPVGDLTVIIAKSSAGGSMGGHSPKKHGKIKYIVRAFGEWAGGKQSIAAKRLLAEHPEVVGGSPQRANALAAWLKDQWAGTTKWRGKRDGKVTKAVADEHLIYEELDFDVDETYEPTSEDIDGIFVGLAELLGHDADEVGAVLDTRSEDQVEGYLNQLLGDADGELAETATTSANSSATLDVSGHSPRRDDGAATGFARVREVFTRALSDQQAGSAPTAEEEKLLTAFESLAGALESTAGDDDAIQKRRAAVSDFGRYVEHV